MTQAGLPRGRGAQTTTAAAAAVAGRVLLRSKAKFADIPAFLPPALSGLVVDGPGATDRALQLRGPASEAQLPLLIDTAPYTYEDGIATAARPLVLPTCDGALPLDDFLAADLDAVLKGQLVAGAGRSTLKWPHRSGEPRGQFWLTRPPARLPPSYPLDTIVPLF